MATTLRTIVNELSLSFKQNFDDAKIGDSQIAYWVIVIANRMLSQHIAKRDSGAFLYICPEIPVKTFKENSKNSVKGRKYIELPNEIFDYNKDDGIEYITFYDEECDPLNWITFTRTTPSALPRLNMGRYEKPTATNPYFYRAGNIIFLVGIECVNTKFIEIGIYSIIEPITDFTEEKLDQPFRFPDELLEILQRKVLDLGRFIMMIPEDRINDGTDKQDQIPGKKLTSVNDIQPDEPNKTT